MATNTNPADIEVDLVELARAADGVALLERHFQASDRPTLWNGLLDEARGRLGRGRPEIDSTADRIATGDELLAALERLSARVHDDVGQWREDAARPVTLSVDWGEEHVADPR